MQNKEIKVTFQPGGQSVFVLPGTLLLEAAGRAGLVLQTPCGGRGTCGKCKIIITKGAAPPTDADKRVFSSEQLRQGCRLACQTYIEHPLVVEIPAESRFESVQQILATHATHGVLLNPVVSKQFFQLEKPASTDAVSDVARLKRKTGPLSVPFYLLQILSGFLRENNWRGTAVVADSRLIGLEAGNTTQEIYGVAFDLGTTTIVGTLIDLNTGKERAVASAINPQVSYGDDVIGRISHVRGDGKALDEMRLAALNAVNSIIKELAAEAGVDPLFIYEVVLAGNSTMQQIFCGLDPAALGEVPFVQTFDGALTLAAQLLGVQINPDGEAFIFPQIGGFVGGDTVAGMLASGLDGADEPMLLVDIGTNGELVLLHQGRFMATSTAAGPAFEGARIVQGMRATGGAIEKVVIEEDVQINVIGDTRPIGICGTALIDTVAELLRKGIIDETGRILSKDEIPHDLPEKLRSRLIMRDGQNAFMLVPAYDTAGGEAICLWQKDVRELQLATGAIRAGINILLQRAELVPEQLGGVLLAGGFGNFIRRSNARRIGLLPPIACEKIHFIGNAALMGAKLALLSADERERSRKLRNRTEHVDLSLDADFQMEFGAAMMFPDDDYTGQMKVT